MQNRCNSAIAHPYQWTCVEPHHPQNRLLVHVPTSRLVAGTGHNPWRAWVFPLCTPTRGINVLQEYAFDHPFHNGLFTGHGRVTSGGVESHFWAQPAPWGPSSNYIHHDVGTIELQASPDYESHALGGTVRLSLRWCSHTGVPLLEEHRVIQLFEAAINDAPCDPVTVCIVSSTRTPLAGAVTFGPGHHGGLCARVQPQLLPALGGAVVAPGKTGELLRGTAEIVHRQSSPWIAYEAPPPVSAGLLLAGIESRPDVAATHAAWWVRDFGFASFNPTLDHALDLPPGQVWRLSAAFVAYESAMDQSRAGEILRLISS